MEKSTIKKKVQLAGSTLEIPREFISESTLGGDVFNVFGGVNFNNKTYVAINYKKKSKNQVRIYLIKDSEGKDVEFNLENPAYMADISPNASGVTSGLEDVSLVVFNNLLYVFYANYWSPTPYSSSTDVYCKIFKDSHSEPLQTILFSKVKNASRIGATVLNGSLYLLCQDDSSKKINILKGSGACMTETDFQQVDTVKYAWLDNKPWDSIDEKPLTYEDLKLGSKDCWDVTTWHGYAGGVSEMMVVGRSCGKELYAYMYDGKEWFLTQSTSLDVDADVSNLKLIQGAVAGITQGKGNPLQFTYSLVKSKKSKFNTLLISSLIPPGSCRYKVNCWGATINSTISTGSFAVVASLSHINSSISEMFQQYIYIIRGYSQDEKFPYAVGRITSNQLRIKKSQLNLDWKDHSKNEELRKLMPILLVVEGGPPTFVNTPEWFADFFKDHPIPPFVTNLRVENAVTSSTEYGLTMGSSIKCIGGASAEIFSLKIGLEAAFKNKYGIDYEKTQSRSFEFKILKYSDKEFGSIFYLVPSLERIDVAVYDYTGATVIPELGSLTKITCTGINIYEEVYPLAAKPSCIKDPYDLTSWVNRDILSNTKNPLISFTKSLESSVLSVSSEKCIGFESGKVTEKVFTTNCEIPFFDFEEKLSLEFEITSKCLFKDKLEVILEKNNESTIPASNTISSYAGYLYSLNPSSTDYASYLQRLKDTQRITSVNNKQMLILCWGVDQIHH